MSATSPETRNQVSEIARLRREQIVEAAVEIITTQGLHNLSLSKIETLAGMKRGQLTYYFPTKEDILLAVFDRLLLLMIQQLHDGQCLDERHGVPPIWEGIQHMLQQILLAKPVGREFHALQYTFLAQIAHREDFREKLASSYGEWRQVLGAHWQVSAKPASPLANQVSGRTICSLFQALVMGLTVQLAADPNAFDRSEMLTLCIGVLAPLFTQPTASDPEVQE